MELDNTRMSLACLRSVALAACVTAHRVQTVSDDVQNDARICACIFVRTQRAVLR